MSLLLAVVLLWSTPLERVSLQVEDDACGGIQAVRHAAKHYLGHQHFAFEAGDVTARVQVQPVDAHDVVTYVVTVDVQLPAPYGASKRTLEAGSCSEATEAAGLILSVALDPLATSLLTSQDPEPTTQPPKTASTAMPAELPPAPTALGDTSPTPAEPLELELHALIMSGFGNIPTPSFGPALAIGVGRNDWKLFAHGAYWTPRTVRLDASQAGATVQLALGGIRACATPQLGAIGFYSCLGLQGGNLYAKGTGLDINATTRLPLLAVGLTQALHWRVHPRIGVLLQGGMAANVLRARVIISDAGTLFHVGPLALTVALGVTIRM